MSTTRHLCITTALLLASALAWGQAPAEPSANYTVQPGDKLIVLMRTLLRQPSDWAEVSRFNAMSNPNLLVPGRTLRIPLRLMRQQAASGLLVSATGNVRIDGAVAQPGAAVPEGSRLETGAESSAVVQLADGTRVTLLPKSLAEIAAQRHYGAPVDSANGNQSWFEGLLRLTQGGLEAAASQLTRRATPLRVQTPTSVVGVRGTVFRVAYDDPATQAARTEVTEGRVRTDNSAQGTGADLPSGTGAVVKPSEREIRVVQLLPAPDLSASPGEILRPLPWPLPPIAGGAGWRVQIASDGEFNALVRDLKVSEPMVDLSSLPDGVWHARVRGIDENGLEGYNSARRIEVRDRPKRRWRLSFGTVALRADRVVLTWQGEDTEGKLLSAQRRWRLALSSEASGIDARILDAAPGDVVLGPLEPGVYFLRLSAPPINAANGEAFVEETWRFELPLDWGTKESNSVQLQRP